MVTTRCPTLIGRSAELDQLTDWIDLADDTGVTFLTGEPGVGKSRLAMELAAVAAARGRKVLTGRAAESTHPVPLRPIVEALIGIARTAPMPDDPALRQYRPALASIVPGWSEPSEREPEISPLILGEALLRLLTALGGDGTLLIIEDLQFADPETLAIVEYLADNLGNGPVRCLATVRDGEPSASGAMGMVRSVHARRAATVVELGRLPDRDVSQMAAECLEHGSVPKPVLLRLLADCDGLPFAVEEILAAAVASGELVTDGTAWSVDEQITTGVPTSIAESVRRRLSGLGPDVTDMLVSAAVIGRQFDWTLLSSLTDTAEPTVLTALRQACDVQLIEPHCNQAVFRFRHSMTRDAILSNLLPPDLARRSAKAAAVIAAAHPGLPGPWCELAAELHERAAEPVQAAELLLEAGRRALQHCAITSAGSALARASAMIDQVPSADLSLRVAIDEALTSVYVLSGNCDQLVPVADRLLAELDAVGTEAAAKALIRLRVARALSEGDRLASAEQQVTAARALARQSPDPTLGGWADAAAAKCAIDEGDPDRAFDLANRGLAAAEAAGMDPCSAEAACEALEVIGRRERARDTAAAQAAFERAYQIASSSGLPVRQIRAMHELGTIEMLEEGGYKRLCKARSLAFESGAISVATVIDLQLANIWSLGTDLDRALGAAKDSELAARRLKMRRVEAMAIAAAASTLMTSGDEAYARAMELAEQAETVVPDDPSVMTSVWGEVRVTGAIFSNDLPEALSANETGIGYARTESLIAPSLAWGYWPLLKAVTGSDGSAALAEATKAGAEVAFWNRGCLAYAQAVLTGRDGDTERATQLADEASQFFSGAAPCWNHMLHRLIAEEAFKDGWGEPARWLRDAIGDLETAGFDRLASACRGILRRNGERVPRSGRGEASVPRQLRQLGITSREMDVLLLVARGISNTQIATKLFISPKTVETHIGSLITKTGQGGRRELVAHAARVVPV
jgi:DNA-binding CsgD family transcriptional regulator